MLIDSKNGVKAVRRGHDATGLELRPLFFPIDSHAALLAEVCRSIEEDDAMPVVVAPAGAGKSSLLYQLIHRAPEPWRPLRIDANPTLHADLLLGLLANAFGVEDGGDDIGETLQTRFAALRLKGELAVVVVDDAEQLPEDALHELLQLQRRRVNGLPTIRVVLFGDPSLSAILSDPLPADFGGTAVRMLDVPRLGREEAAEFITLFLAAGGRTARFAVSPVQIEKIYRESRGLPGALETLTLKLLNQGELPYKAPWRPAPSSALVMLGILVVVGLLVWAVKVLNEKGQAETVRVEEETPPVLPERVVPIDLPPPPDVIAPPPEEPPVPPVGVATTTLDGGLAVEVAQSSGIATVEPPAVSSPPAEGMSDVPEAEVDVPVDPVPAETDLPNVANSAPPERIATASVGSDTPFPGSEGIQRERWLMRQSPSAYTLQLTASSSEAGVVKLIKSLQLSEPVAYYRTERKGKPWFTVVYGVYPDSKAAQAAASKLPERFRKGGAWPRSFGTVQKDLAH